MKIIWMIVFQVVFLQLNVGAEKTPTKEDVVAFLKKDIVKMSVAQIDEANRLLKFSSEQALKEKDRVDWLYRSLQLGMISLRADVNKDAAQFLYPLWKKRKKELKRLMKTWDKEDKILFNDSMRDFDRDVKYGNG